MKRLTLYTFFTNICLSLTEYSEIGNFLYGMQAVSFFKKLIILAETLHIRYDFTSDMLYNFTLGTLVNTTDVLIGTLIPQPAGTLHIITIKVRR